MTFEEYATLRVGALLGLARAICGDAGLAEDLVQDVLLKASRRWDRIQQLDVPDAYVRRMLVNEYVSWRRKWTRIVPTADVEPTESSADPADQVVDRRFLAGELARLPKRQQVVLGLRYYGGLSDAEIAGAMGCSQGTVRGYASRALHTLRIELTEQLTTTERHPR